jgi:hypothetical protein
MLYVFSGHTKSHKGEILAYNLQIHTRRTPVTARDYCQPFYDLAPHVPFEQSIVGTRWKEKKICLAVNVKSRCFPISLRVTRTYSVS